MEMEKLNSPVSEYMKIRRYVLTLIYRNAGKSVQLPTIVELSKLFNVSAPTVNKALKALSDDGHIIGRRGIGSFTNPNSLHNGLFSPLVKPMPLVGLALGDGMPVHINAYWGRIIAKLLEESTMLPALVHQISLSSRNPETVLRELENEQLDGLIWHAPPPNLASVCGQLADQRFPLVIADSELEGVSSVSFDHAEAAYRCGKILLEEGRRDIVFFPDTPPWDAQAEGLRRAYREVGMQLDEKLFLKDTFTLHEKLQEIMASGVKIDAVFGHMMFQNEIEDFLARLNPEIHGRCAVVNAGLSLPSRNPFHRISYEYPFGKLAQELVSSLRAQLGGVFNAEQRKLNLKIKVEN